MRDLIDIMTGKNAKAKTKPIMESGEGTAVLSEAMLARFQELGLLKEGRLDKEAALNMVKTGLLAWGGFEALKLAAGALGFDAGGGGYYGAVGGASSSHPFDGTYSGTDRMGIDIPYREDGQQGIADGTRGDSHGNYAHNGIDPYDR